MSRETTRLANQVISRTLDDRRRTSPRDTTSRNAKRHKDMSTNMTKSTSPEPVRTNDVPAGVLSPQFLQSLEGMSLQDIIRPWPDVRTHVQRYVKRCACCQKMSYLKVPIATHRYTVTAPAPFMRINIDRIGPLPKSEAGYNCILVIIDCFTRWVSLYPLRDGSMEEAKQALTWHMGHWVKPLEVIHDGGTEFANMGVRELFEACGVKDIKTLAYSKEENSLVERANKEVMRHLRNILFHTNITNTWEQHLGTIMKVMNHQKRGNKSFPSPASLLFGERFRDDELLFLYHSKAQRDGAKLQLSAWAADMILQQETIFETAHQIQETKDEAHLAQIGPPATTFEVGSYVLANYHATDGIVRHRGPPNKFLPYLRGPYKVVASQKDRYTIRSLITHKDEDIHVKELRTFIHNGEDEELYSVALRDHQDRYFIDSILDHKGSLQHRRDLEFKVHWTGYESSEDSWVPYAELRDTAALHKYLLDKPTRDFHKLIPSKFFKHGVYSPDEN
jgi:hypothetical protein